MCAGHELYGVTHMHDEDGEAKLFKVDLANGDAITIEPVSC